MASKSRFTETATKFSFLTSQTLVKPKPSFGAPQPRRNFVNSAKNFTLNTQSSAGAPVTFVTIQSGIG